MTEVVYSTSAPTMLHSGVVIGGSNYCQQEIAQRRGSEYLTPRLMMWILGQLPSIMWKNSEETWSSCLVGTFCHLSKAIQRTQCKAQQSIFSCEISGSWSPQCVCRNHVLVRAAGRSVISLPVQIFKHLATSLIFFRVQNSAFQVSLWKVSRHCRECQQQASIVPNLLRALVNSFQAVPSQCQQIQLL